MVLPSCKPQKLIMIHNANCAGMAERDASGVAVRGGAACTPLMMYRADRGLRLQADWTESQQRALLISGVTSFSIHLRPSGPKYVIDALADATLARMSALSHA